MCLRLFCWQELINFLELFPQIWSAKFSLVWLIFSVHILINLSSWVHQNPNFSCLNKMRSWTKNRLCPGDQIAIRCSASLQSSCWNSFKSSSCYSSHKNIWVPCSVSIIEEKQNIQKYSRKKKLRYKTHLQNFYFGIIALRWDNGLGGSWVEGF